MSEAPGLGDVVFRVRDRTQYQMMRVMGQSPVQIWCLTLMVGMFSSLVILVCCAAFLNKRATDEVFRARQIGGLVIVITVLGFWIWYQLRQPKRGALTLYERGFRHKSQRFRFEDVAAIHAGKQIGGIGSAVLSANRFLGQVRSTNRNLADRMEFAYAASVTVVMKDGKPQALNGLTIRCVTEDLIRFFERIAADHPEIQIDLRPVGSRD